MLNDPTESEVRAALEAFERAIRADPRLAKLCGYLCSACGSTDVEAIRDRGDRGMRQCQNCGFEFPA
jgi:ribosomal protein L37AE/L43A